MPVDFVTDSLQGTAHYWRPSDGDVRRTTRTSESDGKWRTLHALLAFWLRVCPRIGFRVQREIWMTVDHDTECGSDLVQISGGLSMPKKNHKFVYYGGRM